jgi:hypothetical protein
VAVEGPLSITLPPAIKDREVLQRYSAAFRDYQQLWMDPQEEEKVFVRPIDLAVSATVALVRTRLDPAQTVPNRLASRFTLAQQPVSHGGDGLASEWVSSSLDLALRERLRYVIPRCLDRVMAYPHLTFPLSRRLEEFAPEVFLPGVGELPDDFLMVLQTNPRFVEALMLGANHEMGRELLWQGFPTDCRGTPFRHFWQRLDGRTDIEPIHLWGALPLGKQNPANSEFLVLLIRGQLLERFPNLSIYAYPITGAETRPGEIIPPVAPGKDPTILMHPDRVLLPILRGHLGKDITYLGFDLAPKDLDSHFFVLEEQMSEPRFGFDEPDADGRNTPSWLDVDWSEVGVEPGRHFGAAALKTAPPAQAPAQRPRWIDPHSATVAGALLQRPFRGFYRGSSLRMPTLP